MLDSYVSTHMWPVNRLESQLVGNFKPIATAL